MAEPTPDYEDLDPADIDETDDVSARAIEIARKTMTGDLRDALLQLFKDRQKPWAQMSESEQRSAAASMESACFSAVGRCVGIIASDGRKAINATLKKAVVKDGSIEGTVVLGRYDDQRHALFDAQGSSIIITIADPDAYAGERKPAEVEPDQPDMLEGAETETEGGGDQPAGQSTQDVRTSPDFITQRAEGANALIAGKDPSDGPYQAGTLQDDAWCCGFYRAEGAKAYQAGEPLADCPYGLDSPAAEHWEYGWTAESTKDAAGGKVKADLGDDMPDIPEALDRRKKKATTALAGHA